MSALTPQIKMLIEDRLAKDRFQPYLTENERNGYRKMLDLDTRSRAASRPVVPGESRRRAERHECEGTRQIGGACHYKARPGSRFCGLHQPVTAGLDSIVRKPSRYIEG